MGGLGVNLREGYYQKLCASFIYSTQGITGRIKMRFLCFFLMCLYLTKTPGVFGKKAA